MVVSNIFTIFAANFNIARMKLSIITINWNNTEGLRKTIESVRNQTGVAGLEIEQIIVDGASTDGSVEVLEQIGGEDDRRKGGKADGKRGEGVYPNGIHYKWISERDRGIYNAMNKGIRMATGDYCQFLNSGDNLYIETVCARMLAALMERNAKREEPLGVLYGNMKKVLPNGEILHDACHSGSEVTYDMFYEGCLNHSPAYIRRALFDKYGYYDESLKICSDWKFYMQALILGGESVEYVDVDVTLFDMTGISETNKGLLKEERDQLNAELIPHAILRDYERYHFPMDQYRRLKKHHLWGVVYFVERVLFKLEKWHILR